MDLKTIVIGFFTLLILLTLFTTVTSSLEIVTYIDKLIVNKEDVFVIHRQNTSSVYVAKYVIFKLNIYDSVLHKPRLKIKHTLDNRIINEIGVKNILIETSFSNSTPIILSETILSIDEYNLLIKQRYGLEQEYIGLGNKTIYTKLVPANYLITMVIYIIDSNTYIDFSKYIPPIIYYPREVVLNTTIYKLLEYSLNDTMYLNILKYSINTIVNEYSFIETNIEYVVYPLRISKTHLSLSWILLFIINEYRKPKITLVYSKKLFYKLKFSINYLLQKLRVLKQRIQELSRV